MHRRTLHTPGAELDACGIGFVADANGAASRGILDAVLEGLARVGHRGAVAADGKTGDGTGVLLPLPAALMPSPWCGLAMVFLRDESAREEKGRQFSCPNCGAPVAVQLATSKSITCAACHSLQWPVD